MKTKMIGFAALVGLMFGLATPAANAHRGDSDIALRLGPAYVYYNDGYRRFDRNYRYAPRNRYGYYTAKRRYVRDRDLWHRCFDGRWYPYYDRQHLRFHQKLRPKYRKHRVQRYRYW